MQHSHDAKSTKHCCVVYKVIRGIHPFESINLQAVIWCKTHDDDEYIIDKKVIHPLRGIHPFESINLQAVIWCKTHDDDEYIIVYINEKVIHPL